MQQQATAQAFRHVEIAVGKWVSICTKCFRTAAQGLVEESLTQDEAKHDCLGDLRQSTPRYIAGTDGDGSHR